MFGERKASPNQEFQHAEDCKIVRADPSVAIPWSEVRAGVWEARCQCGVQYWHAPVTGRARLDPLDARTTHHLPQCEHIGERDPSVLKILLRVVPRDGYSWVECASCQGGWQVPDYAEVG